MKIQRFQKQKLFKIINFFQKYIKSKIVIKHKYVVRILVVHTPDVRRIKILNFTILIVSGDIEMGTSLRNTEFIDYNNYT